MWLRGMVRQEYGDLPMKRMRLLLGRPAARAGASFSGKVPGRRPCPFGSRLGIIRSEGEQGLPIGGQPQKVTGEPTANGGLLCSLRCPAQRLGVPPPQRSDLSSTTECAVPKSLGPADTSLTKGPASAWQPRSFALAGLSSGVRRRRSPYVRVGPVALAKSRKTGNERRAGLSRAWPHRAAGLAAGRPASHRQ